MGLAIIATWNGPGLSIDSMINYLVAGMNLADGHGLRAGSPPAPHGLPPRRA